MDLSVIMTTCNRRELLRRTLLLYNGQRDMAGRFEVVLVDDGSTDGTLDMVEALRPELTFPLKCLAQLANAGPAKARNTGIDIARGSVVFITGDDILPRPDLLHQHWTWHVQRFPQPHVGVLGRVAWATELEQTPLLRWLEVSGDQFAYGDIQNGDAVHYSRLYTSNVSFKRGFLVETGERLDEQIQFLFEDSEWGLRLARKGMELRYNEAAIGDHLHPTTLTSSLNRQRAVGASAGVLAAINPEEFDRVTSGLFRPENRNKLALAKLILHPLLARFVYVPLARFFERRAMVDRIFAAAHSSAMLAGLLASSSARRLDQHSGRADGMPFLPVHTVPSTEAGSLRPANALESFCMNSKSLRNGYQSLRTQAPDLPAPQFWLRLASWQLGKALSLKKTLPIHDRSRMRIRLSRDDHGIHSAIYLFREHYEPSVRRAIDRFVTPGSICYDIGANLGLWTLRMAETAGPTGAVHAFEPHPGNAAELSGNAVLSGFSNVHVHDHGLGDSESSTQLFVPDDVARASLAPETAGDRQVAIRLRPLDTIWEEQGRPDVGFVKVDVEGAEPLVLRGGSRFFATARPVICCEINPGKLAALGFVPMDVLGPLLSWGYVPRIWTGTELADCPPNQSWNEVEDLVLMPGTDANPQSADHRTQVRPTASLLLSSLL